MDYATNPVHVTPASQPTASVTRSASQSEVSGFDSLLQSASSDTAYVVSDRIHTQGQNADDSGTAVAPGSSAGGSAAAREAATTDAVSGDTLPKPAGAIQTVQQDPHAIAMAIELGADVQVPEPVSETGTESDNGILPTTALQQPLPGDTGIQAGVPAHILADKKATGSNLSDSGATNPGSARVEISQSNALPRPDPVVSAFLGGSAQPGNVSMLAADGVVLPSRGLELSAPISVNATTVSATTPDISVVQGTLQSANDPLIKVGRAVGAPLVQGIPVATEQVITDSTALPRGLPAVNGGWLPAEVKPVTTSIEVMSTHAAGAAASATTIGTARELMARQRSGAANDESVSQLSRGGTEARILEVNGARTTAAVTPAGNVASSVQVESKAELAAKHTNAVALAATQDEKLLRVSTPAASQQQAQTRIGGVDVSQIGSVDFAPVRVDATMASQPVSKLSILEPGWTNQLGTDLRALVARGPSTTQVQVTPAELGPLDIEVSINRQEVSVRILAMHGQTREMLESALPRLRETLGQSYASVDVSVGSGTSNSNSGGQHNSGQAGTLGMMSDNQNGLRDSGASQDTGQSERSDSDATVNDLSMDDRNGLTDELSGNATTRPARGLVDAYA